MDIVIKWKDDSMSLQFPINPPSFNQGLTQNNTSLYIHNFGEINLKGKRALKTVSWQSFFPSREYYFEKTAFKDPYDYYIKTINSLVEDNTTVHLVITDTDINMYATIESFSHGEEEKNGDVAYSIDFKEYRVPANTGTKGSAGTRSGGAQGKEAKKTSYKWKAGDTWPKVCKKKLGTSKTWKAVRKKNKKVINKAKKAHPKTKETTALVGYKVVIE